MDANPKEVILTTMMLSTKVNFPLHMYVVVQMMDRRVQQLAIAETHLRWSIMPMQKPHAPQTG